MIEESKAFEDKFRLKRVKFVFHSKIVKFEILNKNLFSQNLLKFKVFKIS